MHVFTPQNVKTTTSAQQNEERTQMTSVPQNTFKAEFLVLGSELLDGLQIDD